jgi:hypothetical protein
VRYWWVNQNQTFPQETEGGYLWSPKRNAKSDRNPNGTRNPFYETMREVSPGDVVFSFCDKVIAAIGVARSYCWESPKPAEFGTTGQYWEGVGWKILVEFTPLLRRVKPSEHMGVLRPLLPTRFSPLSISGQGYQRYLTQLAPELGEVISGLIGAEAQALIGSAEVGPPMQTNDDLDVWEHRMEVAIETDAAIPLTDREAIIRARRGQGVYKQRVMEREQRCRITGVTNPVHLIASHCKPWRDSSNEERLNGENGLLLTPSIDHLFDRGFIGFEGNGNVIISPVAHRPSLERMGITVRDTLNVGAFSPGQRQFLEYHRDMVLLKSAG